MSKLYTWSNQIKAEIEKKKDQLYPKDYKFFKIDRLERIAQRIDEFSEDCDVCIHYKSGIEKLAETYVQSINGTSSEKIEFEKINELIVRHLKQKHRLVQKEYYVALYSFLGFFSGTIVFGLISILIGREYFTLGLFIGFSLGMIIGRVIGRRKDLLKQKNNEIL